MFDLTLETAKVISIDDSEQQGKIQIKIESKGEGWDDEHLPWAIPLFSNVSNSSLEFHPPAIDSEIWVLVDKYYKRFYYLSNRYFYNLFDYSKVDGLLKKCEAINTEYKNLDFKYYNDGTLMFHNNSDSSCGIITPQGLLIYVDENSSFIEKIPSDKNISIDGDKNETVQGDSTIENKGNVKVSSKRYTVSASSSLDISAQSKVSIKSKSNLVELGNAKFTLGSILKELCQDLLSINMISPSGPCTDPMLATNIMVLLNKINGTFA